MYIFGTQYAISFNQNYFHIFTLKCIILVLCIYLILLPCTFTKLENVCLSTLKFYYYKTIYEPLITCSNARIYHYLTGTHAWKCFTMYANTTFYAAFRHVCMTDYNIKLCTHTHTFLLWKVEWFSILLYITSLENISHLRMCVRHRSCSTPTHLRCDVVYR